MCCCEEHVRKMNRVCCGLVVCLLKSSERSLTVKTYCKYDKKTHVPGWNNVSEKSP